MNAEDFDLLRDLLKKRSGLALNSDKMYLVESRLGPIARHRGLSGVADLVREIRQRREEPLLRDVTEAMTTNESFFFRDKTPFDHLRNHILPTFAAGRGNRKALRFWCAACSTGQEPYSIALLLREQMAEFQGWRFEIIGTDISSAVLEKARVGFYSQFEVQRGLPVQLLMKYFTQVGEMWQIDSSIRAMVQFREHNLLDELRSIGPCDVIFCRNVLIYFDQETKTQVLDKMRLLLPDDGVLFLGGVETVFGVSNRFFPAPGLRGVYRATVESGPTARTVAR